SRVRLLEQITRAGGTDADDRLDELRRRHREERRTCLARDRAREQRLTGPRRPAEEDAARDPSPQAPVFPRVAEEVDDLGQLELGLVDTRDIRKCDLTTARLVAPRLRPPEVSEHRLS